MEAVRRLKANLKVDGKACGWCQAALKLGDDAAICAGCDSPHHGRCWDGRSGCAKLGCMNAPLPQLATTAPVSANIGSPFPQGRPALVQDLPPGFMACPHCRVPFMMGAPICPSCKLITSPDGIYHGPKINAPGAVQSLVYGIVGLVFCQIILGPIAISKASSARRAMAADPTLGGEGLATAGMVMGVIDLIVFVIFLSVRMSG